MKNPNPLTKEEMEKLSRGDVNMGELSPQEESYLELLAEEVLTYKSNNSLFEEKLDENQIHQAYDRFCQQYAGIEAPKWKYKLPYLKLASAMAVSIMVTVGVVMTVRGIKDNPKVELRGEIVGAEYYLGEMVLHEYAGFADNLQYFQRIEEIGFIQKEELLVLDAPIIKVKFNEGIADDSSSAIVSTVEIKYIVNEVEVNSGISFRQGEYVKENQSYNLIEILQVDEYTIEFYENEEASKAIIQKGNWYYEFFGIGNIEQLKSSLSTLYQRE